MSNFFNRLFGKRKSVETPRSVENIIYEEIPIQGIQLAQNSLPPGIRTTSIEGSPFPLANNAEEFTQFVSVYRSCVWLINTKDYKHAMLNLDKLFLSKFGKQSDFYSALISGVVVCAGCGKEFNKLLLSLSQNELAAKSQAVRDFAQTGKCPTCSNEHSLFWCDNMSVADTTTADFDALRVYWRHLATVFWETRGSQRSEDSCTRCRTMIRRGNGFLNSYDNFFYCKKCVEEHLVEIQNQPRYFDKKEMRRARGFVLSKQQKSGNT